MKPAFVFALALAVAAPVATFSVSAEAQTMTGRYRSPRPALTERDLQRLYAAEEEVAAREEQIAALQATGEAAGGLTPAQQAELDGHERRRDAAQQTVDRLEAKRERRS